jgi:serine/threonine protein kinase
LAWRSAVKTETGTGERHDRVRTSGGDRDGGRGRRTVPALKQSLGPQGRYRLVRRIASGGMGEVWEAEDTLLSRRVALKVLADELATDRPAVRRFRREARATARLSHPHVTRVYDFVEDDAAPFLVLELMDGQTLAARLDAAGPLPPREAARVAAEIADSLDAAHRAGIVHRDVKPSNVMLTVAGEVKVMDFGIAAAWEDHSTSGRLVATAAYVAPERVAGRPATPAADVYSLGAVLYELLTGRPPFTGDSVLEITRAHLDAEPTPVRELAPWVPLEIAAVCEAALAKEPHERPAPAGVLASRLRALASAPATVPDGGGSGPTEMVRSPNLTRELAGPDLSTYGYDPSATVEVGQARRRRPSSRRAAWLAAAVVAVVLLAGGTLWAFRSSSGQLLARPSPPQTTGTAAATPSAPPAAVTVTVRYTRRVWTQATVDGRVAYTGTAVPGEQRTWTGRHGVDLVLGNPVGVELAMDGRPLGTPGTGGRVWRGSFRPGRPPPPLGSG